MACTRRAEPDDPAAFGRVRLIVNQSIVDEVQWGGAGLFVLIRTSEIVISLGNSFEKNKTHSAQRPPR
jgi:hypothetical protein